MPKFQPPDFVQPSKPFADFPQTLDALLNAYQQAKAQQGQKAMQTAQLGFDPEQLAALIGSQRGPYQSRLPPPQSQALGQPSALPAQGNPFNQAIPGLGGSPLRELSHGEKVYQSLGLPENHPMQGAVIDYLNQQKMSQGLGMAHTQAQINKLNAEAGGQNYTLDQAAYLQNPTASPAEIEKVKSDLSKLYPGGIVPKDAAHLSAAAGRTELSVGMRSDQFHERQWNELAKRTNPNVAPRGSLLGIAGQGNARADRALTTLADPKITPQQVFAVVADYAGIMQGGSPHEIALRHMGFNTLAQDWANLMTKITSSPQTVNQPEIVNKLKQMIMEIKQVDNKIISDNLKSHEQSYKSTIQKDPQRWEEYKKEIMGTMTGVEQKSGGDPLGIL